MESASSKGHSALRNKPKLGKRALKRAISDLVRRREEHEERINKLLDPNYHQNDATKPSPRGNYQEFSEMLRKLEVEEPQVLQESIGNLGNHVNLLATVSLKTDYFLNEKPHCREQGELYSSLLKRFPKSRILHHLDRTHPEAAPEWFSVLVEYLLEEELANGLFSAFEGEKGQLDFYGTRFQHGKYDKILISRQKLEGEEERMIVANKDGDTINIGWLLLGRLLGSFLNLNFPLALHRLFSFPYKRFPIRQSIHLVQLTQTLSEIASAKSQNQAIKMYGIQKSKNTIEIDPPHTKNISNYVPLLHRYNEILLIDQTEFSAKSLPLSCLKNHFVVVTLIIKEQGHYYLTVAGKPTHTHYRLCLLNFQGEIVQHETINSGEFMLAYLNDQEYELYISPEGAQATPVEEDQSFQLVKEKQEQFWLWVQGKGVCTKQGDLQLEIRLKEQYNSYTMKIAKEYLSKVDKNEEEHNENASLGEVVIKRYFLKVMNLVLDEFHCPKKERMMVKYKEANLCDQLFEDNAVTCVNGECCVLRAETEIESVTNSERTKLKFTISSQFF